jgi:hypothetical protein
VKKAVIDLVPFVSFRHFKQTPMQVIRHIKLIAHETISNQRWYKKTKPYRPSQVMNCLVIISKLCQRCLSIFAGKPLSQELTLRDWKSNVHGTSSTFQFFYHLCPVAGRPVAKLRNCSSISNWTSPTLAQQPSKVNANCRATQGLKPSNFCMNGSHPNS